MKVFRIFWLAATAMLISGSALADTAELQVIHNSADPGAAVVDVYVNDGLFLDDFAFRTATPFVEVPAGVELNIGVAPPDSDGPEDIIGDPIPVTLEARQRYVAFANGVIDPSQFADNPDGRSIGFTLFASDDIRKRSPFRRWVNVISFHGATDAPSVDIVPRNWPFPPLAEDLGYGEFSRYRLLKAREYILDVKVAGTDIVAASFKADLSSLRGRAVTAFASGFLNPDANQGGAAFGLFAALEDGTVAELMPISSDFANLQVIHNSADPGAAIVDVYVNDDLLLDDFAFRTATPFVEVPAGVELNIGVAPPDSDGPEDIIGDPIPVTLGGGKTYVAVANGVINPDDFAPNPDGRPIGFTLFARDGVRQSTPFGYFVDVLALHGASDAPAVDIVARAGWLQLKLFRDLKYGDFSDYRTVFAAKFILDVRPAGSGTTVASFKADLRGLRGKAITVFASGFLDPSANQDGAAFGLFAALPDGTVAPLPPANGGGDDDFVTDPNVVAAASETPKAVNRLDQNFPNPFNPTTTISFSLATAQNVRLNVYNVRGQLVAELVNEVLPSGLQTVSFDASQLASGTYFYRIQAGDFVEMKKMVLLK